MLYNLTDILSSEEKVENLTCPYEKETASSGFESYPILETSDLQLTLSNRAKGEVQIEGKCRIVCEVPCDRCLKPVRVPLTLSVDEYVKMSDLENPDTAEELPFMEGFVLDTDVLLGNEIIVNWPVKVLCRESCKGVCKMCGKDLNEGDCECDTFVPDPRMAVIKDIFNA